MKLVFPGTGGYHPNERRHTTSLLLPEIGVALDALIHECYFPDELADLAQKTGHSSSSNVAELAKSAEVKRLYLVHVDPQLADDDPLGLDIIRAIFAETELAEDLMEIEF